MKLIVNGTATEHRDDVTVADVVSQLTVTPSGVAVAVNGVVVAHSAWTTTPLTDNDSVEVLTAVQGG